MSMMMNCRFVGSRALVRMQRLFHFRQSVAITLACLLAFVLLKLIFPTLFVFSTVPSGVQQPNVFIISMKQEKFENVKRQLVQAGVPEKRISLVPGVNGSAQNLEQLLEDGILSAPAYTQALKENEVVGGHFMTPGGLGCYLAHTDAWRKVHETRRPALVLEDDVVLGNSFWGHLLRSMQELPVNWHLLYPASMVQSNAVRRASTPYSTRLLRMRGETWGTYAYVVSPAGARDLLSTAFPAKTQVDSYIIERSAANPFASVFRVRWNLLRTSNSKSRQSAAQRHWVKPQDGLPLTFHEVSDPARIDGDVGDNDTSAPIHAGGGNRAVIRRRRRDGNTGIDGVTSYEAWRMHTCYLKKPEQSGYYYAFLAVKGLDPPKSKCLRLTYPSHGMVRTLSGPSLGGLRSKAAQLLLHAARDGVAARVKGDAGARLRRLLVCLVKLLESGGVCIAEDVALVGEYEVWEGLMWHTDAFAGFLPDTGGHVGASVLGSKHNSPVLLAAVNEAYRFVTTTQHPRQQGEKQHQQGNEEGGQQHEPQEGVSARAQVGTLTASDADRAVQSIMSSFKAACLEAQAAHSGTRCHIFAADLFYPRPLAVLPQPYRFGVAPEHVALTAPRGNYLLPKEGPYGAIPKTFHFIWPVGCKDLNAVQFQSVRSWLAKHPGWKIRFWTEKALRAENLELQPLIDEAKAPAQKSDLARLEIIAKHGGVYVDSDMECLRNIEPLLEGASLVGCHENGLHQAAISLSTGFFAGTKQHPLLVRVVKAYRRSVVNTKDVNMKTGPAFFRRVIGDDFHQIRLLPARWLYPIRYDERALLVEHKCFERTCAFFGAYAVHLFREEGATWAPAEEQKKKGCDTTTPHIDAVLRLQE